MDNCKIDFNKNKVIYQSIDMAKFIFSILVVALHCGPLNCISSEANYLFTQTITRLAVPFFFVCNGFFAFLPEKYNKKNIFKQCVKLWRMYCVWLIIYLPGFYVLCSDSKYPIRKAIVLFIFGRGYAHLWYLAAAGFSIGLVYIVKKFFYDWKIIFLISGVFYVIGLSYDSYYGIFRRMKLWDINIIHHIVGNFLKMINTTRGGLFFGFLFVVIGAFIAQNKNKLSKNICIIGFAISFFLLIVEVISVYCLRIQRLLNAVDMYIFLVPVTFFLFEWLINCDININSINNIRKESMIIYLVHIWVRTIWLRTVIILNHFFPLKILDNSLVVFLVDVIGSIVVARIIIHISKMKYGSKLCKWIL